MRNLWSKRTFLLAGALGLAFVLFCYYSWEKPRVLAVSEVPIAFWSWRTQAPSDADVQKAFAATNAKTLFLRAGQIDLVNGSVARIRPVLGKLPSSVELHLVYNGTRRFLYEWDKLDAGAIAGTVAAVYQADLLRARADSAQVTGLQLDLDVPDRILPRYADMLLRLRTLLPADTRLSITGLPGWADVNDIRAVLAAVDFWVPQCYGGKIPTQVGQQIPISSAAGVARTISRVRRLGKPFYAGLSAYSYAILYAKDGSLSELRGDLDPAWAVHNANLELTESEVFKGDGKAGEVRHVYRANSDVVLDGLIVRAGETLVFDLPSAASLRAGARAVRENAGDLLLGICLFRMPTTDDRTTLTLGEIAGAVADIEPKVATSVALQQGVGQQLTLAAENKGTAASLLSENALTIDLSVPAGSVTGVSRSIGFTGHETLCRLSEMDRASPCSRQRANVIRLTARAWRPAATASITINLKHLPADVPALVTTALDDGRIERESLTLKIANGGE